jgi:cellobiose transport system permease protein
MLLVPNITSVVAVAYVFGSFFAVKHGLVNQILVHVFGYTGPDGVGVDWQENALAGQIAISSMIAWRWVGYNSLIFLASMNAIPKDLYESSSLDGATRWQQFRFVTMPQLRNTITFMLVMGTIGGMSVFAEPSIYSGSPLGGDHSQFLTLTMYLFYYAYTVGNYGYASAIGIGIAVIVMVFSLTNFVLTRRIASEDSK